MATYEGWQNRETWQVALLINNEQDLYFYWMEEARSIRAPAASSSARILGDRLEDWLYDELDQLKVSNPILKAFLEDSLNQVNFTEVAEHLVDAADESV